ncbi:hypothetical protein Ga0466249_000804 [Sporomusaceae bacterium BoRhaA]|nr:hypothetical protein [Pelorhabdus rhamnosifermentans]
MYLAINASRQAISSYKKRGAARQAVIGLQEKGCYSVSKSKVKECCFDGRSY